MNFPFAQVCGIMYNCVLKNSSHHPKKRIIRFHSLCIVNPFVFRPTCVFEVLPLRRTQVGRKSWVLRPTCHPNPSIKPDLHYIFDLIYQNKLPQPIKRYFTDVYLFCLHKDPTDTTKLRPLGIPTAIRRLIASHVAHTL